MKVELRAGTMDDILVISQMVQLASLTQAYKTAEFDTEKTMGVILRCIENGLCSVVIDNSKPGTICGCIMARVAAPWWSNEEMVFEVFTYMVPNYRRSLGGRLLYREFIVWCQQKRKIGMIAQTSGHKISLLMKLWMRLGFQIVGTNAIYRGDL